MKRLLIAAVILLVANIGIGAAFCVMAFWPYKPLRLDNEPLPILNRSKEVEAGNKLYYRLKGKKNTNKPVMIIKQLIDTDVLYTLPIMWGNLPQGDFNKTIPTDLPANIEAKEYQMRITYSYPITPFRWVSVVANTERFIVTNGQ